jgi:hypothetical protein
MPDDLHFSDSLDAFRAYFVNRHIDHHGHCFIIINNNFINYNQIIDTFSLVRLV